MEAKELRIGNLIYNGIGEVFEVNPTTIGSFDLGQATLGGFKPIPLTEQWLLDFGFEKYTDSDDFDYYKKDGIDFTDVLPENLELSMYENAPCKYVHQLQNLYFAITGDELTIKEKG